jgi:oxazoline/thiazoline synthase
MITKPKFKEHFYVEIIEPNRVFLLSEKSHYFLTGHLYYLLAPLLNGYHTVADIAKKLQKKVSLSEIYYTLMHLENKGYIVDSDNSFSVEEKAFWNLIDIEPKTVVNRSVATKVAVTALGQVTSQSFISILESLDIDLCDDGDIQVVLTDDYLRPELYTINQKALKSQRPWMLVKPVGAVIWIGPIFYPGKTGCWACLAQRLQANRKVETFIQKNKGIETPLITSLAVLPSTLQTALNMAATEVAKWVACGENKKLEGNLVTFNTISLETQTHTLIHRPQCPCCGTPEKFLSKGLQPPILESQKKTFTKDGGHRSFSPEETLKKYQHHISPITGIVDKLRQSFDENNGLTHAYSSGVNLALAHQTFRSLHQSLRSRSAGKGMSDSQAQVSCLCETLERYSGVFQGDEICKKASYKQMGKSAIHPNSCMNFSEEQYKNREKLNANLSNGFHWVPVPFDEELEIDWTPIWSLTHEEFKYLPTAYCYYSYPIPDKERNFCHACSNGGAAGNTLEEAILQGFMELVERDSVCLWWYNRVKRPAVNLESFDEPYISSLKEHYKTIHRDLWVLDLTSDLNIPTFVAISRRTDKKTEDILLGFGSHFDAKVAILRAITELNQFLPAVLSMTVDDSYEDSIQDADVVNWWKTATLENQPYLVPDENTKPRLSSDYPSLASDDLLKDVMTCVEIAKQNGMEVLVLDQTRPDVGLNVVKVIVPGMRHFWARFGDGRLYDVPVKLGWLEEALKEEQLNPIPLFA